MEKLLPIGSVVYLNEGTKKLMIAARGVIVNVNNDTVFFDYGAVPYPEGFVDNQMAYFQRDGIAKVVFEGYSDLDDEAAVTKIENYIVNHPEVPRGQVK